LFRKKYKEYIDRTEPNRELINSIFEKAEQKKSDKTKLYKFTTRYGAAIAAVFVLSVSAVIYTHLNNSDKKIITVENSKNEEIVLENTQNILQEYTETDERKNIYSGETKNLTDQKTTPARPSEVPEITERQNKTQVEPEKAEVKERKAAFSDLESTADGENQLIYSVLKEAFGEFDEQTGNQQIFEIAGKFFSDDEQYYLGRWRWLVNNDHSSLLCEFVLKGNLSEMYECVIENDYIIWTNGNNILEN